ncbi:MAG: class I SAM-dependent methyltransferase, partial [Nanoarchaeota archaeon]|nr:class I SAM-dependent methyltransferase [Nanoarchaeota archaeon]
MDTKEEKQARQSYNTMARFYHEYRTTKFEGGWFFNEYLEMPAMLKALGNVKDKKILDWGCGSGIYAKILSEKGAKIKGFDISKEMLKIARESNPRLDLRIGSGLNIPFDEKFDIVFSSLALNYLKDWDRAFKEISRVLKKGGYFLFSIGNPIIDSSESIVNEGKKVKILG